MGYVPPPTPQYGLEEGPVLLKDGRTALLRRATPKDLPLFVEFLGRLSPASLRMRFFSPISPEKAAELLLSAKPEEEKVTLIVLAGEPQRIVATGEYVRAKGEEAAEVAFLVEDAFQGKGLGTLLLERLALIAAKRGVRRFQAFVLAENRQMLNVFTESGFQVKAHRDGGEVEVEFEILLEERAAERFEWREKVSTLASLHPFFFPRGVAVVGASRDPESIGYRVLENLIFGRFQGPVYPVNEAIGKEGGTVGPLLAYPNVESIPGPVDLAVIAVPKERVLDALEACGRRGLRGAILLTTGFTEREARELADKARRLGMRLLGPGSLGLFHTHPEARLAAGLAPLPRPGPLALSSQSGTLGRAVMAYAEGMGLGVSAFVSLGAKTDISSNDLLQFWEEDERTRVILLYLEGFGNPRRFSRLARRIGKKKPILAVHPSRDPLVRALFAQAGVVRANSLEEAFDAAALLALGRLPGNNRVCLISNASGPSNLALEVLKEGGLEVEHVDLGSTARAEDFARALEEARRSEAGSLFLLFVPMGFMSEEEFLALVERAEGDKLFLACSMGATGPRARLLGQAALFRFPESAAIALARAWAYRAWREEPLHFPDFQDLRLEQARRLVEGKKALTEEEARSLLQAFGLPLGDGEGLALRLSAEPHPLFGPVLTLLLPTPLGNQVLGKRLSPLTEGDARELFRPLEGKADPAPYREIALRLSRLLEELPQVEGVSLDLAGPRVARFALRLHADPKPR
ncbi:GNAT family N-acetyltransferase [Thermus thermamylovorans]|uniref:GNAT family N-acetyltransferase n=1 Tax=Thermus thermamylovorans TaxID=2509362 RepID=A0A4Q9B606_9DEIN|nr:GNAT family N-acetyltransferase [Thermus thermamylovorans]TBH20474.1 GNAT family N-acetyltransferase [Thermus thermamylovorans]